MTYTATYLIYEGNSDPLECTVRAYVSVDALRSETLEVIARTCCDFKAPEGAEILVDMTITDSNGEYVDSDNDARFRYVNAHTLVPID